MILDTPLPKDAHLSLKALLKAHLFGVSQQCSKVDAGQSWRTVPMTQVNAAQGICYQSAIALQQARGHIPSAIALAHQWLMQLQTTELKQPMGQVSGGEAGWRWNATDTGWLVVMLPDGGSLAWLREIADHLSHSGGEPLSTATDPYPTGHSFRLCEAWQLSLPGVLQWGQVWCGRRQRDLVGGSQGMTLGSLPIESAMVREFDRHGGWSRMPGTRDGVQAIATAMDRLVEDPGDRATYLHQGYAVTAAIVQMDAGCSLHSMQALDPVAQAALITLFQATQALLQHLLIRACGQRPVMEM